jgi:hypothetical protein
LNYFPNATFVEWLWTIMNFIGVVVSVINTTVIYSRGRRIVKSHRVFITNRAVGLLFIQRVIRSNVLGIITFLFFLIGVLVIVATNSPGEGAALLVGPAFGISLFIAGALIAAYQTLEMVMRPEIDEAIELAMVDGLVSSRIQSSRAYADEEKPA